MLMEDPTLRVRSAIVRHLSMYPEASDTVDGIRQFWLGGGDFDRDLVESVLAALVREQIVRARRLPDGGVMYSAVRSGTRE